MRKYKHLVFGGIQQKIVNLVLITMILVLAAFAGVVIYQSGNLTNLVRDTSDTQKKSITEISEQTMKAVIETNLTQSTQMEAYIAQDLFGDAVKVVNIVADYTEKLFADPESFPERETALPDKDKNGETSLQVLTEEGIDITDPVIADKLALIGNLSELMVAVYSNANVDSCYVALPDGVMLLVDNHSASKFDENGNIISIPIRERLWYKGACEAGKLHFTDVTTDLFTGEISIMCSLPVYVNGELVAVIGTDLFLNDVAKAVEGTANNGSFICIVNQNGHVLFSAATEGTFRVVPTEDAPDLRNSENAELSAFVLAALREKTDLRLINVDGEERYLVGAPIGNVGWAVLSIVPKALADMPAEAMLTEFNDIQVRATETFNDGLGKTRTTIIILVIAVFLIASAIALWVATRIVKPLRAMTERVCALGGDDLRFRMEDQYRTKDEIELLAESFAMLSEKTLQYITETKRVTAEKERIGTELSLANRIQADMLPNIYPAFPERPEFDVYATMAPAKEVGGDFYDFFLIDEDHLCVFIADVSGKGVPAALFMMASMIILANNAQMGKSPAQILYDTNSAICKNNREEMFVTVWLGILEISTGKLTAANAGHEFPAIKNGKGIFELFKDKHGFVIGGMDGARYREYEIMLDPGSKLFVYTDGVPEATSAEKKLFGTEKMLNALNVDPEATPDQILMNVRKGVDDFVKDAEQFDDITMLCLEYKGKQ